jgi:hypothetical protein
MVGAAMLTGAPSTTLVLEVYFQLIEGEKTGFVAPTPATMYLDTSALAIVRVSPVAPLIAVHPEGIVFEAVGAELRHENH